MSDERPVDNSIVAMLGGDFLGVRGWETASVGLVRREQAGMPKSRM